jgi:hypothetical protein
MRTALVIAAVAAIAVALLPLGAAGAQPGASPGAEAKTAQASCQALQPTRALRRTLRRVHVRTLLVGTDVSVRVRGPLGRVYYGRCGGTRYALASFWHVIGGTNFGTQDQPERFRRRAGRRWMDRGDTGGQVCGTFPAPLIAAWGFNCP